MQKRGQLMLFVILMLVVLIASGIVYYLVEKTTSSAAAEEISEVIVGDFNLEFLDTFIPSCLDKTSEIGLLHVAARGGYNELPNVNYNDEMAYFVLNGQDTAPTDEEMANELFKYVDQNVNTCIQSTTFPGIQLKIRKTETLLNITDKTFVTISLLIQVLTPGEKLREKWYRITVDDLRLVRMFEIAEEIRSNAVQSNSVVCINCVLNAAQNVNFIPLVDTPSPGVTVLRFYDANDPDFVFNLALGT